MQRTMGFPNLVGPLIIFIFFKTSKYNILKSLLHFNFNFVHLVKPLTIFMIYDEKLLKNDDPFIVKGLTIRLNRANNYDGFGN